MSSDLRPAVPVRPTRALVSASAIAHNLAELRRVLPRATSIIGVVKADAYGHGAVLVARALAAARVDWLGVAVAEEGIALREAGIQTPILVLDGIFEPQLDLALQERLTPVVFSEAQLAPLAAAARRGGRIPAVHVKIDTGMGRLGLLPGEVGGFAALARSMGIPVAAVMSHLANADTGDEETSRAQMARLDAAVKVFRDLGFPPFEQHLANTAAALEMPEACRALVRPGLALYGHVPAPRLADKVRLRPALSWVTEILQIKRVPAGYPVSYGGLYRTARPSSLAVLPVGYADGYRRSMTGRIAVLVRGRRVPVAGAITMDLTIIDVTDAPAARVGDPVVLIGRQGEDEITVQELAAAAGTIPYEIFCGIGPRVPRVGVP